MPERPGRTPRVAVAGNPNAGKTSIFNELTGTVGAVANYPGVTVETRSGKAERDGRDFEVVDLPGTYSLTAYSGEELVARNFIIEERPEVVIDVVDASNLERNLYLTVQLMEMRAPLVIALNMVDLARARGVEVDAPRLSRLLGVPVVPTVGNRGEGVGDLLSACARVADESPQPSRVTYGHMVEGEVTRLALLCGAEEALARRYAPRWLAVKLLEGDPDVLRRVRQLSDASEQLEKAAAESARRIELHSGEDPATIIAERRYGFAAGALRDCIRHVAGARRDVTERIDAVVCNRYLGPLVLAAVVYVLFLTVFRIADRWGWIFGKSPKGWVDALFAWLASACEPLRAAWPALGSMLIDGGLRGVGSVISFVPLIFIMFLFVAFLEDSGYIARVAFIMDRLLKAFGLQGKSILAMIVSGGLGGGGCAVPGVMAARTLREEKDRLVTILVAPLMNCGAKMPVYIMLVGAFFAAHEAGMLFLLWALSWCFALSAAWLLRKFVIRGEQTPFVMELPPYHMPTLRGVLLHTWERTWAYIRKAGTVILAVSVVLWALMYFPRLDGREAPAKEAAARKEARLAYSAAGRAGRLLEPLSKWAGFTWRENVALIGGFAAKEVVVSTMGTAYAMGEVDAEEPENLSARLRGEGRTTRTWNPLRAFTMMVFVMLYSPCLVTLAVIRRETGSWKWPLFSTAYSTLLAFAAAVVVYRAGLFMGWGLYP